MIDRLITLCSRLNPDPASLAAIQNILSDEVNWNRFVQSGLDERVTPLLYRNLKRFPECIPGEVLQQLKGTYLRNVGRNLQNYHAVAPILQEIEASGLRMAMTKGARLAETVYKDPGLRYFTDIDFMAHPDDLEAVRDLLIRLGFWKDSYASRFENRGKRRMMWIMETGFRKQGLLLDIHFRLPSIEIPLNLEESLWRDLQTLKISGVRAKILALEHELAVLCLHAQKHNYQHLIWLTDIAETVGFEDLDWEKLEDYCRCEEIIPSVFYGLYRVDQLWPDAIPSYAWDHLQMGGIQKRVLFMIWPKEKGALGLSEGSVPSRAPVIFQFFSWHRLFFKLKLLWDIVFPPQAYLAYAYNIPLNSHKMVLHFFWRAITPVRVLWGIMRKRQVN